MNRKLLFLILSFVAVVVTVQQLSQVYTATGQVPQENSPSRKVSPQKSPNPTVPSVRMHFPNYQADTHTMSFGTPIQETSSDNARQTQSLNSITGQVVYTTFSPKMPYQTSLVIWNLKNNLTESKVMQNSTSEFSMYPAEKSDVDVLFSPLFSPDGRYILYKFGQPWSDANGYHLYVLDTKTHSIKLLPPTPSYMIVAWSPDSNYIACIEGGDTTGNTSAFDSYIGPLNLNIYNWRTGKKYRVAVNDSVRGPFSWVGQHNLIYGVLPDETRVEHYNPSDRAQSKVKQKELNKQGGERTPVTVLSPQPNVYEFAPESVQPKLLFKDGYRPVPSADGQLIAFFGSENPNKPFTLQADWENHPHGLSLCIAQPNGAKRKALDRLHGSYPFVIWLPDNRHLLTIQQVQPSPNAQAQIKKWDAETGEWQNIAVLQAKDYKPMHLSVVDPQFQPLGLSHDGSLLFVLVTEFTGHKSGSDFITGKSSLQSVDLRKGSMQLIAEVEDHSGADWHEQIASPSTSSIAEPKP